MDFSCNPAALDEPDREQLQRELRDAGFYFGRIDGDFGPKSRGAWAQAVAAHRVGPILRETDLTDDVRLEFARLWALADVLPEHGNEVTVAAARLLDGRARYEAVQSSTGVPWYVVGLIHLREASFDFRAHLHNGDPLTARTVHVPAGRPLTGRPPFDWAYSAADAFYLDGLTRWTDWSLAGCLHKLEAFNGYGPRFKGRPTSYLWNMTAANVGGKFVADHVWDSTAVDAQPGCAAVLKVLEGRGAVVLC